MKALRKVALGFMILLCVLVAGQAFGDESKGQVLLILRSGNDIDYMLIKEFGVMKKTLDDAGFTVVVATASGQSVKGKTVEVKADLKLSEAQVADYKGFIIPCMSSMALYPDATAIVKKVVAQGKPIAAQNAAVFFLFQAGALKGKNFAIADVFKNDITDGKYCGIGVVQDGNIVTSGTCPFEARNLYKPDGTLELTQKLIALMQ